MAEAHVIVLGNEKGGTGKSTTAVHIIVGLMGLGLRVASLDLDVRQRTLTRYLENRKQSAVGELVDMMMPTHRAISMDGARQKDELALAMIDFAPLYDVVVIDCPGADTDLARAALSYADTLITPINDSFVDLDVLARVEGGTLKVERPSHYAEAVWDQKKQRIIERRGGPIDWIVMRNRLSHINARNKEDVAMVLDQLCKRIGCRAVNGFSERVIYRELFLKGLTMMDLSREELSMSHVAARQEVRALIESLHLPILK